MKLTNREIVEQILERIKLIQQHTCAVIAAKNYANRTFHTSDQLGEDLIDRLCHMETEEWRNLFMWGLTLTEKEQERIKTAAYKKFLSDGISVANWWNDNTYPGHYFDVDEKEFREMARKVFGPKEE